MVLIFSRIVNKMNNLDTLVFKYLFKAKIYT